MPEPPAGAELYEAGLAWWSWAWKTPQATRWDEGSMFTVLRRAILEDRMAALGFREELDLASLFESGPEAARKVSWALDQLKRQASGETILMKEARALDDALGLSPKAMQALRWSVGEPSGPAEVKPLSVVRDARAG